MGTIVCKLFEKEAPQTVENFVGLARGTKEWTDPKSGQKVKRPLYNGTIFHRVIPKFMIQGGDPRGDGTGDPGYSIKDEIHPTMKFDQPGRLAMARTPRPNSGGCQFFITEVPYPSLDGQYSIFGQVVEGQDLVSLIANVPRDPSNDRPRTPVVIRTVRIERHPLAAPSKKAPTKTTPAKKTPTKATPPKA
jgi:cyclophilin family peptidyl-prolyl cis-trans isomerase